jgi:predicted ATPase
LVSGEAGIGKSRIAAVLVDRLREQPSFRLRYFCSSHYENSALYPVTAQLERGAGFARQDPLPTRLEKFRTLLTQSAATDDEAALIGELLSLPLPASGATAQLTAQRKKERTLEALVRQMEALSENRPLLMVWEDVHWIDPTSRELLDLTIARLRNLRVLLIITFRPEFEPPWIAQAHVGLLALSRLDAQDGTTLAEHVAGKSLPPAIVARIAARADGIPLFVEELTRALIETGSLPDDGSRYEPDHPALLAIPPSLHASLLARLDRLAQAREVAQIGAAIGREFSYELLSAVAGKGDQELQHALDQLVEAGLVFRRGEPPHTAHLFKHALVQDAAYGTLLRGPRQSLHRRIAIALENKFPEVAEARPELLAQHLMNAGLIDKAIKHWGKAAERSISRSAMAEALVHAERGLNLLSALPDGAALRSEELALQVALGRALMVVRGPSTLETGQALLRARELCRELDEADVLLQIMCGQYMYYQQAGQFEAAHKIGDDLLTFATERRDSRSISIAQFALGCTSLFQGDGIAAYSALEQCIIRPSVGETSAIFGWDVGAAAAAYLGVVLFCLGKLDQAMAQSHAAIEKASELAHPETEAVVTAVVCRTFWLARNYQALRQRSEVYDALIAEHDLTWFSVHSNLYRGWFQVEEGSAEEGLSLLERSLAAYRASGHGLGLPYMLAVYAAACQKAGRLEQAWKLLAEAAEVTEQSSERWFEPELERLKGKMLVAAGSAGEAEPHLEKAIALARARSAKSWELRAATCLARLWREQGRGAQARDLLAPVYGWFTEGFETADLKEAKALLHELIV